MSAANSMFARAGAGLLVEGDRVSLAEDLRVEHRRLHDLVTGAGHGLRPEAEDALALVRTPADAGVWLTHIRALGLEPEQAAQIVTFLNQIGALRVDRSLRAKVEVAAGQAALILRGGKPTLLARRLPLTPWGVALGATLALGPVLLSAAAVAGLEYGAGLGPAWIALTAGSAAVLWLSVFAHELAHAAVLRRQGAGGVVLQQGMRLGIIHGRLSRRAGVTLSLAGPLAGAAVALAALGLAAQLTHLRGMPTLAGLTAGFHLLSLLPVSADGRILRRHLFVRSHAHGL